MPSAFCSRDRSNGLRELLRNRLGTVWSCGELHYRLEIPAFQFRCRISQDSRGSESRQAGVSKARPNCGGDSPGTNRRNRRHVLSSRPQEVQEVGAQRRSLCLDRANPGPAPADRHTAAAARRCGSNRGGNRNSEHPKRCLLPPNRQSPKHTLKPVFPSYRRGL